MTITPQPGRGEKRKGGGSWGKNKNKGERGVYLVGMMPAHCSGGPALLGTCRSSHTRFLQVGCSPSAAAASTKRWAAAL